MKIASVADVKAKFSAYLKSSAGGPVVITRNGRPVAVLLGVEDEEEIEGLLLGYSPHLRAILDRSRVQIREGEKVAHEQFWADTNPPSMSPSSRRLKKNKTT
jgi:prevent-host-death family protein